MSRAEGARRFEFGVGKIDGDDGGAAGESGPLHAVEADAAATDHHDAAARLHARRIDDGAKARQHAAGDQRCAVERHVLRDCHRLGLVDDHPFGERAGAKPMDERLAGAVMQRG